MNIPLNGLTTHILDTARGLPASGVLVRCEQSIKNEWVWLAESTTDADGRARLSSSAEILPPGTYRLTFEVENYFESQQTPAFYPLVQVIFAVREARHYHVPLLLSPFGYSTYRGS